MWKGKTNPWNDNFLGYFFFWPQNDKFLKKFDFWAGLVLNFFEMLQKWQISEKTWPFDCDCFRFRISQNDRTWFGISQTIGLWETFWFGISQNDKTFGRLFDLESLKVTRLLWDFLIWNLSKMTRLLWDFWFGFATGFCTPSSFLICDALAIL